MEQTKNTVRLITIIKKSDDKKILEAATVDSLEINFYNTSIDLEFIKDDISYTMHIKNSNDYKIIIE